MTTPELIRYVKNELDAGITRDLITIKLKEQGWSDFDVIEVFNIVAKPAIGANPFVGNVARSLPVQNHKGYFNYLLPVLIIIIVLAIGFVGYSSGYFVSPSKLFSQSVASIKNSNGVTMDMSLSIDSSLVASSEGSALLGLNQSPKVLDFQIKNSIDMLDKENLKSTLDLNIKADDMEIGMDSRVSDGILYLNLNKAPNVDFLKSIENKWVSLPYKNNTNEITNNILFASSDLGSTIIGGLTDGQKQQIYNITDKASLLKITKKHLPEIINGSVSYHFSFDLDREGITSYFKEMATYLKSIDQNNSDLSSIDVDSYDNFIDSIKEFKGEAWIGIFDHLPHKIVINGDLANIEKPNDGVVKLSMTVLYSDWNRPVIVEIPQNSINAEELLFAVLGVANVPSSNPSNISVPGKAELKSDDPNDISKRNIMEDILAQGDSFYMNKNSYKGFCRDKTSGAYPLAITLPKNSVYKCNDVEEAWASWVQLSTKDYWCADSNGASLSSKKSPSGTSCPAQ